MDNLWITMWITFNFMKMKIFIRNSISEISNLLKRKKIYNVKDLLTQEEFLRFTIIQKEISLEKVKKDYANFLKKKAKK